MMIWVSSVLFGVKEEKYWTHCSISSVTVSLSVLSVCLSTQFLLQNYGKTDKDGIEFDDPFLALTKESSKLSPPVNH